MRPSCHTLSNAFERSRYTERTSGGRLQSNTSKIVCLWELVGRLLSHCGENLIDLGREVHEKLDVIIKSRTCVFRVFYQKLGEEKSGYSSLSRLSHFPCELVLHLHISMFLEMNHASDSFVKIVFSGEINAASLNFIILTDTATLLFVKKLNM